jgi:hypothetical protein
MSMSTDEARGARAYVFNTLTLICDNDQGAYNALTGVAREALTEHEDLTLDRYQAIREMGPRGEGVWSVAGAAGEACAAEVQSWTEGVSGVAGLLLTDLLDFGDSQLWAEIGWHYLPDADEVAAEFFDGYADDEEESA